MLKYPASAKFRFSPESPISFFPMLEPFPFDAALLMFRCRWVLLPLSPIKEPRSSRPLFPGDSDPTEESSLWLILRLCPCWSPLLDPVSRSLLNMLMSLSWALSGLERLRVPIPMLAPRFPMSRRKVPFPTDPRDFVFFGRSFNSIASSRMNSL